MLKIAEFIRVELTMLSSKDGGRKYPLKAIRGGYMPHIVIGDLNQRKVILINKNGAQNHIAEKMLGVAFWEGPKLPVLPIDESFLAIFGLIYAPSPIYDEVETGVTFTLREGGLIAGFGTVLDRWAHI